MAEIEEMPTDEDTVVVGEPSHYSKKSGFDKGLVVQVHVQKCLICRAKDLSKPGYITWIKDNKGNAHPQEIPDFRKEYIGAVEGLKAIMLPEIMKDDVAKKSMILFETKINEVFLKYGYRERLYREEVEENSKTIIRWVYGDNIYMPELGATLLTIDPKYPNSTRCVLSPNVWDNFHNAYYQELIKIYDWFFGQINILIDENNYFKAGSGW